MAPDEHIVDKEMGYTHADFLRLLPKAVGDGEISISGHTIQVSNGERRLRIDLSEESVRHLGHFRLPVTHVQLTFSGYSDAERSAALERFWKAYQKGGG
ncbi:MAG: hypothetical protein JSU82_12505 [Rhodospirillales bacterium]|nr:MAG: hypothetical protein JSU82_12505 [Rhodospirillales bacterium]